MKKRDEYYSYIFGFEASYMIIKTIMLVYLMYLYKPDERLQMIRTRIEVSQLATQTQSVEETQNNSMNSTSLPNELELAEFSENKFSQEDNNLVHEAYQTRNQYFEG